MDISIKTIIGAAVVAAVALGGTWAVASNMASPELVAVTQQGCGAQRNFQMPLSTAHAAAPGVQFTYGPIELASVGPVTLAFRPDLRATNEVSMENGAIVLPMTFGNDNVSPTGIRINCRDGNVASVRFERDRTNRTFNIVRPAAPEGESPQT